MSKPKIAFYWCTSCGGCEEAVVDLNEDLLRVAEIADIVFWPVALDFKKKDVESLPDSSITVSFINGAIRSSENVEMVKLLSQKSKLVVAFGACAHLGGIPGLGNFYMKDSILRRIYQDVPTVDNPQGVTPQKDIPLEAEGLTLPEFNETVKSLDQVISVNYYLPGCPPPGDLIIEAINAILNGKLPKQGKVLAPNESLCETCTRAEERPEKISIAEIKRPHEISLSAWKCFLEQGVICLGPATRTGCGERCIKVNMPCRGCMGPLEGIKDHGLDCLLKIASLLGLEKDGTIAEEELKKLVDKIHDPEGIFYRFSLPSVPLGKTLLTRSPK
jgi:F420-non-reducing hydrogenase small subunit